jgi:hypothetical protein
MAPVLKTGRAKALVGSNPTPSASSISILDFGLKARPRAVALRYGRIADLRQKKIATINAALRQSRRRRHRTDNPRRHTFAKTRSAPEILRPEVGDLDHNGYFAISRHV